MYSIFSAQENSMYRFVIALREVKFVVQHNCWAPGSTSIIFCRLIVSKLCLEKVKFSFTHYLCVIQCACLLFLFLEQLYFHTNFDERLPFHTS